MELPRNCRIVRQQPQRVRPDWGEISENKFHGGHGLVTLVERTDGFPQDEWLVLEYPIGTDPLAVVDKMGLNHLWDVVLWDRPIALLIRCGPLKYLSVLLIRVYTPTELSGSVPACYPVFFSTP